MFDELMWLFAVLVACGCVVYVRGRREAEAQRQQRVLERIAQANSESVDWPRPYGSHRTPWRDRRKEIA